MVIFHRYIMLVYQSVIHMAPDPHVVDEAVPVWLQDALSAQSPKVVDGMVE